MINSFVVVNEKNDSEEGDGFFGSDIKFFKWVFGGFKDEDNNSSTEMRNEARDEQRMMEFNDKLRELQDEYNKLVVNFEGRD